VGSSVTTEEMGVMTMFCEKCESGDIHVEVMWSVTGREGDKPHQLDIAECKGCGHRWPVK